MSLGQLRICLGVIIIVTIISIIFPTFFLSFFIVILASLPLVLEIKPKRWELPKSSIYPDAH